LISCTRPVFFFFSSRRRHTRFSRDWSSDVCSSDLCRLCRGHFSGGSVFAVRHEFLRGTQGDKTGAPPYEEEWQRPDNKYFLSRCFISHTLSIHVCCIQSGCRSHERVTPQ